MTQTAKNTDSDQPQHSFGADVSRLLNIVANALYTNHDVFLRELISNASDACDRLRYAAIQQPDLVEDNNNFRIHIYKNTDKRTLTIVDNGIGMDKAELMDNLGTIAKSGTAKLMEQMKDAKDPLKLIGQFGVGFYASYMVASHVTVASKKADSNEAWVWSSDGASGYDIREASNDDLDMLDGARGTVIILDIKDEGSEFLIDEKIRQTVEEYSDHIDFKIFNNTPEETDKGEGKPLNKASAIWTRNKSDITKEQYEEFYRHITHGMDEPLLTSHWKAEGVIEFSSLLFIPTLRPWDLYDPSRQNMVKLYVRRVFISDKLDGLMYPWLRFVRGVIDSQDLPLNISRETLQYNPIIAKIRTAVTKRVLSDLDKLSRDDYPGFITFWGQFGAAIKEGLYDADAHREDIFKICRFYSTHEDGEKFTSLDQYIERMQDDQNEIYYISGENVASLKNSPQLEGFRSRGLEVLFFTDTIDDFWLQNAQQYKGKTFKSVTHGNVKIDHSEETDEKPTSDQTSLIEKLRSVLEDDVSDIRISKRLTDSPVCLVAPEDGVDMNMERVLKIHQKYAGGSKPVLEINATHPLIIKVGDIDAGADFDDAALMLLDQARVIQGLPVKDPGSFTKRLTKFMEKGL
ncbi:MAG: molecular chaperone HtpG [Micavibrio sp.]|nr:molecular chaperone HtpG [Micavibrio sp.]